MIWFFKNDHELLLEGLSDDLGDPVTGAVVNLIITDPEENEVFNQNMDDLGNGDYSVSLDASLIPENETIYNVEVIAEKNSLKSRWIDALRIRTRRFSEY